MPSGTAERKGSIAVTFAPRLSKDLATSIAAYYKFQTTGDGSTVRRQAIAKWRLLELLQERLLSDLMNRNGTSEKLDKLALEIAEKKNDPYSAVEAIISG